ncbi:MAG: sulfurtransferase [Candidatus Wallbacteria bacterium HGW-Wallbacteria-1]|uniref:Sulfurtransferase n=1 Tax=Candidatus Wallbacteria bacterium HGW-Wallbacteria-1 TaxID=2013854 RepID=A0A2N1PPV5_9BACT|nr:MAG: sulfurtransferase [Candidatus Wallbacteria bacterium HGW-Wallbacteria-1]
MKKAGALIIDVRTPQEYSADGGVRGAVNIPLQLIQDGTASLPGDMNTAILVYCRSGSRSSAARQLLIKMGYTSVENLGSLGSARDIMEKAAAE